MYAEFATDPKVQMLSEIDQRRFLMILCLRCCNGDVTLQDTEVAFQLRVTPDEYAKTKVILTEKGLVGSDNKPTSWDKRQMRSDTSNERVSRFREKLKQEENATVTLQKRSVEKRERESKQPLVSDERFGLFWKSYPKKVARQDAERAWKKANINGEFESVISALEEQKRSEDWTKEKGKFIPHPASWINKRRWEDEITLPVQQAFDPCRGAI